MNESELTSSQRTTFRTASKAFEGNNADYAITLLSGLVKEAPAFLEGRKLLRQAALKKTGGGSKIMKSFGGFSSTPQLMKAQSALKKDPMEALALAEDVLKGDPTNQQAGAILSQAAQALDMQETACFALEHLALLYPNDLANLHALGNLYLKYHDNRAKEIFENIINQKPNDGEALSRLKDAEAMFSMSKGGWEGAKDFRELIHDKDSASQLEQASKITKSEEAIDALIKEHFAKAEAEPTNVLHFRRIAELYKQKNDLENAEAYFTRAYELTGKTDPGIEKSIHEIQLKRYDDAIAQWEEYLAANPNDPDLAAHQETVANLRKQKAGVALVECRSRVAKYPNDLQFKFELGEALFNIDDIAGAIPELQASLRQPSVRLRAMHLLSKCFVAKGQLEIAKRRLEEAESEMSAMDDMKKAIIYDRGLILEKMDLPKEAYKAFSSIYEVDYGYRDVAQRVEGYQG